MSAIKIYDDKEVRELKSSTDQSVIARELAGIGVLFEQWTANRPIGERDPNEAILEAYGAQVDRLKEKYGFQSVDVVSLHPDHPDRDAFRRKFLDEHVHEDFEVRFFVRGQGLFYLHVNGRVYCVLCEQGDLISVPADTRHWFDMGTRPRFTCIRLFTTPEGWVADFTGDDIARRFPSFDDLMQEAA